MDSTSSCPPITGSSAMPRMRIPSSGAIQGRDSAKLERQQLASTLFQATELVDKCGSNGADDDSTCCTYPTLSTEDDSICDAYSSNRRRLGTGDASRVLSKQLKQQQEMGSSSQIDCGGSVVSMPEVSQRSSPISSRIQTHKFGEKKVVPHRRFQRRNSVTKFSLEKASLQVRSDLFLEEQMKRRKAAMMNNQDDDDRSVSSIASMPARPAHRRYQRRCSVTKFSLDKSTRAEIAACVNDDDDDCSVGSLGGRSCGSINSVTSLPASYRMPSHYVMPRTGMMQRRGDVISNRGRTFSDSNMKSSGFARPVMPKMPSSVDLRSSRSGLTSLDYLNATSRSTSKLSSSDLYNSMALKLKMSGVDLLNSSSSTSSVGSSSGQAMTPAAQKEILMRCQRQSSIIKQALAAAQAAGCMPNGGKEEDDDEDDCSVDDASSCSMSVTSMSTAHSGFYTCNSHYQSHYGGRSVAGNTIREDSEDDDDDDVSVESVATADIDDVESVDVGSVDGDIDDMDDDDEASMLSQSTQWTAMTSARREEESRALRAQFDRLNNRSQWSSRSLSDPKDAVSDWQRPGGSGLNNWSNQSGAKTPGESSTSSFGSSWQKPNADESNADWDNQSKGAISTSTTSEDEPSVEKAMSKEMDADDCSSGSGLQTWKRPVLRTQGVTHVPFKSSAA